MAFSLLLLSVPPIPPHGLLTAPSVRPSNPESQGLHIDGTGGSEDFSSMFQGVFSSDLMYGSNAYHCQACCDAKLK